MTECFDPGLDIIPVTEPLNLIYGHKVFGPKVEIRYLNDIRKSLKNPDCDGPDKLYAIAMDVGYQHHRQALLERHLLFGVVTYPAGQIGDEPVRSQGHIHIKSPRNGWSTPEVYEIWSGRAIILMQESAKDNPGRCIAVEAWPGDVVIVPPYWAHATISADPSKPLTFGAWCDRAYGFEYDDVRTHGGMAWFPTIRQGTIHWEANPAYKKNTLVISGPRVYHELNLDPSRSIYKQFAQDHDRFLFVPNPNEFKSVWKNFLPV